MPSLSHEDNLRINDYNLRDIRAEAQKEVEDHFRQDLYLHTTLVKRRSQYEPLLQLGFSPDKNLEELLIEKCEGLSNVLRKKDGGKVRAWLRQILPESERGEQKLLEYIETTVKMVANNH